MDTKLLNKKMLSGFVSLTFRRVLLLAINFLVINIILAKILPVEVIGVFNIANSFLAFFTFFSDIGLAAAIIQKKHIDRDDLRTTFTIGQSLALIILILVWLIAPFMAEFYKIGESGMWLVRALSVSFFLVSLKVIPSVLLERDLRFVLLVWVEVFETLIFNGILVYLVYQGQTIEAFTYAVIARSIVGVVLIYLISPWQIGIGIVKKSLSSLLGFGIPYQLNSVLAMLKDRLVPLVISAMIGPLGVGYISWAQSLAFLPLEVMNIIIRVTFPAYSRLQDDPENLSRAINKSLFLTVVFLYPLLFGLVAVFPSIVNFIVSDKWNPAIPLFYLYALTTFWASLSTTFTNVLNAVGRIKTTLKLMIMWTVLTWLLSPVLVYFYGYIGAAVASGIISFTSIIPVIIIKKILSVQIIDNTWRPFIASLIMALCVYLASIYLVRDIVSLIIIVACGGFLYVVILTLIARTQIKKYIGEFR